LPVSLLIYSFLVGVENNTPVLNPCQYQFSVCLVWRRGELILIELSLRELILVKS